MLVKLNVPVSARHHDGRTALHDAPTYEIAEYLLRQDHSLLWARDASGRTVLHGARNGAIAECFLHKDPSMLSARDADGETPLFKAFARNNMELWQTLSKHSGNAHDCNNDGQTGLHLVAKSFKFDKYNLTEFLIEQGLAGIRDHGGNTALHLLNHYNFRNVSWDSRVLQLLDAGETLLSTNMTGLTAAERVFKSLRYGIFFSVEDQRWVYRIVIYFMEELRQEEESQLFGRGQLDILYFICHCLREISRYEDAQAEEMIRQGGKQGVILEILTRQRESGWQLPMSERTFFGNSLT
jgi:hypothetical protein